METCRYESKRAGNLNEISKLSTCLHEIGLTLTLCKAALHLIPPVEQDTLLRTCEYILKKEKITYRYKPISMHLGGYRVRQRSIALTVISR